MKCRTCLPHPNRRGAVLLAEGQAGVESGLASQLSEQPSLGPPGTMLPGPFAAVSLPPLPLPIRMLRVISNAQNIHSRSSFQKNPP